MTIELPYHLKNYARFNEIEIGTNKFIDVKFIFTFDYVAPLLIGYGEERPLIWLSMKSPATLSWFFIVAENSPLIKEIFIDITIPKTTIIKSIDTVLIEVYQESSDKAIVKKIDLRPIGLNIFNMEDTFTIGTFKARNSTFENSNSQFTFQSSLKEIYASILKKFPAGREASYLLNNKNPDIDIVRQNLVYISEGRDSDRRYTDENSKMTALHFLKILNESKGHFSYFKTFLSKEQQLEKKNLLYAFDEIERNHRTARGEVKEISLHSKIDFGVNPKEFFGSDIEIFLKVDEVTEKIRKFLKDYNFEKVQALSDDVTHILGNDYPTIKALERK